MTYVWPNHVPLTNRNHAIFNAPVPGFYLNPVFENRAATYVAFILTSDKLITMYYQKYKLPVLLTVTLLLYPPVSSQAIPIRYQVITDSNSENPPTIVSHSELRIQHGILTDSEDTHSDAIIPENIVVNTVAQSNNEVSTTRISHNDVGMEHNIVVQRRENTDREETIPYSRELPQVDDAVNSLPTHPDASSVSAWMCDTATPVQPPNMMHTDLPVMLEWPTQEQCDIQSLTPSFSNTEGDNHSMAPESPYYQNVTQAHDEHLQSLQHDTLNIPENSSVIRQRQQTSYATPLNTYIPPHICQEQEYTSYQSVAGELPRPPETSSNHTLPGADTSTTHNATQANTKRSTLTASDATTADHQTMSVSSTSHQQTGVKNVNDDVQATRTVYNLEWQQIQAESATATSYCAVHEPQQPVDHTPHHVSYSSNIS